jgi:hypothetical protein
MVAVGSVVMSASHIGKIPLPKTSNKGTPFHSQSTNKALSNASRYAVPLPVPLSVPKPNKLADVDLRTLYHAQPQPQPEFTPFGRMVQDGLVLNQHLMIRSYEVGADQRASIQTLMNHLQVHTAILTATIYILHPLTS